MNMKTASFLPLVAAFFFLLLIPSVLGIGISPPYREMYFEPGLEETFHFIMIGNKESDLLVRPYVEGDLKNYITIPNMTYLIPAGKGMGIAATISLPQTLPPGKHVLRVGIQEEFPPGSSRSGIVAVLGVESLLAIRVPYPAKYLDMKMRCGNAEVGQNAMFEIDVTNLGTKDLHDVSGHVEIFSPEHKKMAKIVMNEGSLYIPTKSKGAFTASWDTSEAQPGLYDTVATINYDGNETSTKCSFRLGDLNINIGDFGANNTQKGGIAKFVAILQSTWNSEIPQVFNRVDIMNKEGELVGTSSSETIRVGSWSEKKMTIYWDTGENDVGEYTATLTLEYEGRNSTKSTTFKIVDTFEWLTEFLSTNWHLIVIIALVLLIAFQATKSKRIKRGKGKSSKQSGIK